MESSKGNIVLFSQVDTQVSGQFGLANGTRVSRVTPATGGHSGQGKEVMVGTSGMTEVLNYFLTELNWVTLCYQPKK
jgi:hypothetical protein